MQTSILVDGGFFIKRYRRLYNPFNSPKQVAQDFQEICKKHISYSNSELYRIFFYDCPPISKKAQHPITMKGVDFSKSDEFKFRNEFHEELKKLRKVALRLGRLAEIGGWTIKNEKMKLILNKTIDISNLNSEDVTYDVRQKGVDMKIGLDIASLAYKKLVNQIILIAGDSDFVPAAKLARREGIDFILDPMWNPVNPDLHEHIDGLRSTCPKPKTKIIHGNIKEEIDCFVV
jgi:uncharacterized LabA/DUF88 family protein